MRVRGAAALAIMLSVAGCSGGWLGPKDTPDAQSASSGLISRPKGPSLVDRCPVPISYDDATEKKIQEALDALPKDSVLRKVMTDYEAERDNLRMCH